ncbi:AAA family ATPase [Spirosoma sp. KNUC1025]|uniref:AAA family ATPase n=1 Tax=Spirosoma sp. KNUC1025 TaxID=2894082 RepID=UPI00386E514E|nr:AAA family ATPase [Spirosoma sp. KNUC1025]
MDIKIVSNSGVLTSFSWNNIPKMAIITGANGVGKSALLEHIYNLLKPNNFSSSKMYLQDIATSNISYNGHNNFYDYNALLKKSSDYQFENKAIKATEVPYMTQKRHTQFNLYLNTGIDEDLPERVIDTFNQIIETLNISSGEISLHDFEVYYHEPIETSFENVTSSLELLFISYYRDIKDKKSKGIEINSSIQTPWEEINYVLKEAEFPYMFFSPTDEEFYSSGFTLRLVDSNNNIIHLNNLSSGEKVIITLVLYLFVAKRRGRLPKIMLLDEPDAHLHPQLTSYFLNVVKKSFVETYDITVIITTHSPSTIALIDNEKYLFEMSKNPSSIKPISKNRAISMLTAGLVFVSDSTKYVFVEDEDDVIFYTKLYKRYIEQNLLNSNIPLIFIAASTPTKSGGKIKVKEWTEKIKSLNSQFNGLIDKDFDNDSETSAVDYSMLNILHRYSIENYWADPLSIFSLGLIQGFAPEINGVNISKGDEYSLKYLPKKILQSIIERICSLLLPEIKKHFLSDFNTSEEQTISVKYYVRKSSLINEESLNDTIDLNYPSWILKRRGKDIINTLYRKAFPNSKHLTRNYIIESFDRSQFLPADILKIFQHIQNKSA